MPPRSQVPRIVETRTFDTCRVQVAEHSATGWTVSAFLPGRPTPITLSTEDPAMLDALIQEAQARARTLAVSPRPPSAR